MASSATAAELADQAARMLEAERPERAAFLLSVARDKGGASFAVGDLAVKVEDALDEADETRSKARAIEEMVVKSSAQFDLARLRALGAAGLGTKPDGTAGTGDVSELASANVARKTVAYAIGDDFSDAPTEAR